MALSKLELEYFLEVIDGTIDEFDELSRELEWYTPDKIWLDLDDLKTIIQRELNDQTEGVVLGS